MVKLPLAVAFLEGVEWGERLYPARRVLSVLLHLSGSTCYTCPQRSGLVWLRKRQGTRLKKIIEMMMNLRGGFYYKSR